MDKELEEYMEENSNFLDGSLEVSGHWITDEDYKELAEAFRKQCDKQGTKKDEEVEI